MKFKGISMNMYVGLIPVALKNATYEVAMEKLLKLDVRGITKLLQIEQAIAAINFKFRVGWNKNLFTEDGILDFHYRAKCIGFKDDLDTYELFHGYKIVDDRGNAEY